MRLPSMDSLLAKASATFTRFPLAIFTAIVGSLFCILLVHLPFDLSASHHYYWNIVMTCYLSMLLFIAISIYIERKKLNRSAAILLNLTVIAILVAFYFWLPPRFMIIGVTRFILFTIVLHLLIAFIPFLSKGEINGFWQYNKVLFLRFLTSALYTVALYLGLILAVLAIDKLFNANINDKVYAGLWFFLAGVFNTWFFLAGVPKNFEGLELKKDYPKGLKIFTQYVLLPLISIYLIILYAYMFRIIITVEWPVGWVSYLIIGFSIGGIFSLLLIYPVRNDEESKWILIFSRFFYFALFPLVVLLFFAVKRRISDYGITEQRYFVLALALWLLFIAVYFLFSKSKNIKLIPISLCVIALAASFGPWGAFSVSLRSQNQHLKSLLTKNAMLHDGKIVKVKDSIPFNENKQISSIINYLVEVHGYKTLQPFFAQNLDSLFKSDKTEYDMYAYTKANKIHSLINLPNIPEYKTKEGVNSSRYVNIYTDKTYNVTSIEGYDYLITNYNVYSYTNLDTSCKPYLLEKDNVLVCYDFNKNQLSIIKENEKNSELLIDVSAFIKSLESENGNSNSLQPWEMTLTSGNSLISAKIVFDNINFQIEKETIDQLGFTADIFIRIH